MIILIFKPNTAGFPPKIRLLMTLLIPHIVCGGNFDDNITLSLFAVSIFSTMFGVTSGTLISKGQHTFVILPSNPQNDFLRKAKTDGTCLCFSSRVSSFGQRLILIQTPFS